MGSSSYKNKTVTTIKNKHQISIEIKLELLRKNKQYYNETKKKKMN